MDNIRIIKTGLNVGKYLKQLKAHPEDWGSQKKLEGARSTVDEFGFPDVQADVLQLIMGGVTRPDEYVGDTEICVPTPASRKHTEIMHFLSRWWKDRYRRCGYLSLPVGGTVGRHIDIGSYYQDKDRYHLSIQGKYRYFVGDEHVDVEPGTLLWFNNKLEHGTENIGDEVRITFVFDAVHHKDNQ